MKVRAVARTFNTMRERLQSMVEARAFALAAISHDLRTPLTRLRLRIHALPAEADRDRSERPHIPEDHQPVTGPDAGE